MTGLSVYVSETGKLGYRINPFDWQPGEIVKTPCGNEQCEILKTLPRKFEQQLRERIKKVSTECHGRNLPVNELKEALLKAVEDLN